MLTMNCRHHLLGRPRILRTLASAADTWAALTPPLFLLVTLLLESVPAGYSRIHNTISELALLPYGWVETALFVLMGLALLLIAGRLYHAQPGWLSARLSAAMMALAGLGFLIIAVCPTGPDGSAPTTAALIHRYTAMGIAALSPLISLALAWGLRHARQDRLVFLCLLATGLAGLGLGLAGVFAVAYDLAWLGGLERAVTLGGLVGVEVIIFYLTQAHGMAPVRVAHPQTAGGSPFLPPHLARVRQASRYTVGGKTLR